MITYYMNNPPIFFTNSTIPCKTHAHKYSIISYSKVKFIRSADKFRIKFPQGEDHPKCDVLFALT